VNDRSTNSTIDELLDHAIGAIKRGDRATADALAGQVLAVDRNNSDAEELLANPGGGEIRRLTMLFADLVDSTALSTQIEPEIYHWVVGRYRDLVTKVVNRFEGHIGNTRGDGVLAVFGHPTAHENDAHRAVQTGLDIINEVAVLSSQVRRRFGFDIHVRIGVHRGVVYLDIAQDDVYGLGANLAARVCSIAEPGTVAVSEAIERVVHDRFELELRPPAPVKGFQESIVHYRVIGERDVTAITRGPLVGRERELEYLRDSWQKAVTGTLTVPCIAFRGEGGIGKSRLAAAALDMAKQSGAVVLDLYGSPFHQDIGLRPVRRLLERRCGIHRGSDPVESLGKLTEEVERFGMNPDVAVPLLAPVLGIGPESGYLPAPARAGKLYDQIAGVVKEYLLACIGSGPGLVLVEDIHWFDEDTIGIVQALLQDKSGRLLVVVNGRELPAPLDPAQIYSLGPLSDAESDALILALYPELTPAARAAVRQRCDGIPLYIEEVVAKLKDQTEAVGEPAQVPDTLYEALMARLQTSRHAPLVVEAAALVGRHIDHRLLASAVELDTDEVDALLDEFTRAGVLRRIGADSWRFRHELLREVAAELSPPSVRRRLHSRIADALVGAADDAVPEWALVAYHYEQAGRFDEVVVAYQKASTNARQRGALVEARNHLTRALGNVSRLPAGPARDRQEVAVRLELGFLTSVATGHASTEAAAEFERCLQLVGDEPSSQLYATFTGLWSYYATRGDLRRATQLVEALRNLPDMPEWYEVAIDVVLGVLATFRGEFRSARATLESAAEALNRIGSSQIEGAWFAPNDPLAGAHTFLGLIRFFEGDMAGAESAFALVESHCDKLAFPHGPFTLCYGRAMETMARVEAGQLDRATQLVAEVADRAEQHGFDEWVMIAACNRASIAARAALAAGETDTATLQAHIEAMTVVVDAWRAADMKTFLAVYDGLLARLLTAAGMKDAARERVELALQMADETGMHFYDAELLRIRAHTYDDPDAHQAGLRAAIDLARHQGTPVFEMRAAADGFEVFGESGRPLLEEALSHFVIDQTWPELARARALLR
jgi:class 3 adenylate cyclase/tetratricopeptide (TPR) repeat protein